MQYAVPLMTSEFTPVWSSRVVALDCDFRVNLANVGHHESGQIDDRPTKFAFMGIVPTAFRPLGMSMELVVVVMWSEYPWIPDETVWDACEPVQAGKCASLE